MKEYYSERFNWIFKYTSKSFFYCLAKTLCITIGLPIYCVMVAVEMVLTFVNMIFAWFPIQVSGRKRIQSKIFVKQQTTANNLPTTLNCSAPFRQTIRTETANPTDCSTFVLYLIILYKKLFFATASYCCRFIANNCKSVHFSTLLLFSTKIQKIPHFFQIFYTISCDTMGLQTKQEAQSDKNRFNRSRRTK